MKKIKTIIVSLFVMALLAVNFVEVNNDTDANGNLSLTALLNKAFADDPETGTEILQKIKEYCVCYDANQIVQGVSVTECEDYVWFPPLARTTCSTNDCPPNSSC